LNTIINSPLFYEEKLIIIHSLYILICICGRAMYLVKLKEGHQQTERIKSLFLFDIPSKLIALNKARCLYNYHVKHCIMSILIYHCAKFILDLNVFEFNFKLLIQLELMLWEETCIIIIWLIMLGVILVKYYFEKYEFSWFFLDFNKPS